MPRLVGASTGLLLFAAMLIRGGLVDNPPEVILQRALAGLFIGVLLGAAAGWVAACVLREWLSATAGQTPTDSADVPAAPTGPTRS